MENFERLLRTGLSVDKVQKIMQTPQPVKELMLLGLPMKTSKHLYNGHEDSFHFKGTKSALEVADFRVHRYTQKERSLKYTLPDHTAVARQASKHLQKKRDEMVESGRSRKLIPLPGWVTGKQETGIGGPRVFPLPGPSPLNDSKKATQKRFEDMEAFYEKLCAFDNEKTDTAGSDHGIYISDDNDSGIGSEPGLPDSTMGDLDEYDIEMAKAGDERLFKELFEEHAEPAFQIPGLPSFFNHVNGEGFSSSKRDWDSVWSSEVSGSDRPPHATTGEKRRKLETGSRSSQAPSPGLRKKSRKERGGKLTPHDVFCQSSSLAAVFQAAIAVGALETVQDNSSDGPELNALDLELLGEGPSKSEQIQSPVSQALKVPIAEAMYQLVSDDEMRVANAAANLLEIHQGNSNVSELDSSDRQALKEAFGTSQMSQQSADTVIPRKTRYSDRCFINKSLMIRHGYKWKPNDKPIGPSIKFKSFFATRRQRKELLRKGERSWDEEDSSFMQSGKKFAEPGARLGAEFVAKSMLDGRSSPLQKLVQESQMSPEELREQECLRRSAVKKISRRDARKIARMQKSGLGKKMAGSIGKRRKPRSKAPPLDRNSEWEERMAEVEEELAKWEEEDRQRQENGDNA